MALLPEIEKTRLLDFVEESVILWRKLRVRTCYRRGQATCASAGQGLQTCSSREAAS
jgi:hypothetical protein